MLGLKLNHVSKWGAWPLSSSPPSMPRIVPTQQQSANQQHVQYADQNTNRVQVKCWYGVSCWRRDTMLYISWLLQIKQEVYLSLDYVIMYYILTSILVYWCTWAYCTGLAWVMEYNLSGLFDQHKLAKNIVCTEWHMRFSTNVRYLIWYDTIRYDICGVYRNVHT